MADAGPMVAKDLDGNLLVKNGDGPALTFKKGTLAPETWAKLEAKVPGAAPPLGDSPAPMVVAPPEPNVVRVNGRPDHIEQPAAPNLNAPIDISGGGALTPQMPAPTPLLGQKPAAPSQFTAVAPLATTAPQQTATPTGVPLGVTTDKTSTWTSGVKADKASIKLQDDAVLKEKQAADDLAEVAKKRAAGELDSTQRVNAQLLDMDTQAAIKREAIAKDTAEAEQKYTKAVEDFSKMKVDSKRSWNSKDAGSKFGLIIGAMLGQFGASINHTTNTAMDTLNKRIDEDIADQRDEIMNAKEGVTLKNNLVGQLRAKGLSLDQATIAAKQVRLEQAKREADAIALEHKSPEIDAQNAKVQAELDKRIADTKVQQSKDAQGRAQVTTQSHIAPLTGHAAGGAQQLPAGEAAKLGEAKGAVDNLNRLAKQFEDKGAGGAAGFAKSLIPFTDANKYDSDVRAAAQVIGGYLEGGKLTDTDYAKYMDLLPNPGQSAAATKNKLDNLRNLIGFRQKSQKEALQAAGYNVAGIKDANPTINFTQTGQ